VKITGFLSTIWRKPVYILFVGRVLKIDTTTTIAVIIDCPRRVFRRLRHSASSALFERRDVVVVCSVSCIYEYSVQINEGVIP
jgi:hypothetical protein